MTESRTATNALLGSYVYNERGLRIKAERSAQSSVQVVAPNGGESLYLGALDTISWNGMGLAGASVKLELLVGGAVAGTIAENLPGTQTSFQWQVGKTLTGTVNPGSDYKVRVTAVVPPASSGTTYYFYDSGGKLLAEYDGTGTCVKDYLYLGGKMIGEYVPATSAYYYYASDQINSTRMVTDSTGAWSTPPNMIPMVACTKPGSIPITPSPGSRARRGSSDRRWIISGRGTTGTSNIGLFRWIRLSEEMMHWNARNSGICIITAETIESHLDIDGKKSRLRINEHREK